MRKQALKLKNSLDFVHKQVAEWELSEDWNSGVHLHRIQKATSLNAS